MMKFMYVFYQMCSTLSPQLQKYVFLDMNIKCEVFTLKHLFKLYMPQEGNNCK